MLTTQDLYAVNLPQHYGYPLHSPGPGSDLEGPYSTEGIQIGDVGYVDREGEFRFLLNIGDPLPDRLLEHGFPQHKPINFGEPHRTPHALPPGHIFMTGVRRKTDGLSPDVDYEFTARSDTGAILILPSGASLLKLPQEETQLDIFREVAREYAHLWCRRSGQDTLYLVTSMYKTHDFTLATFSTGHHGGRMLVKRTAGTHGWTCAFETYSRAIPPKHSYENQTILIQGFRMTLRWNCLLVIEPVPSSLQLSLRSSKLYLKWFRKKDLASRRASPATIPNLSSTLISQAWIRTHVL